MGTGHRSATATDLELVIKRTCDAPRELVWKAWTEPERILQWLGPEGYRGIDAEMDAKVSGTWHFRMRAPEGHVLGNGGRIRELVEYERLAFTFAWDEPDGTPGREMLITIDLVEVDGKTEMTFTQAEFESREDRDGHNEGWSSSFNKLEAYLAST